MPPRTRGTKGTKSLENSLVANRPKRICRLPSKFDDHFISPSKYIPLKPCHASTPILENKSAKVTDKHAKSKEKQIELTTNIITSEKRTRQNRQSSTVKISNSNHKIKSSKVTEKQSKQKQIDLATKIITFDKRIRQKRHIENSPEANSDSNNNAKRRLVIQKNTDQDKTSPKGAVKTTKKLPKKITNKSYSLIVLEDKKKSSSNEDKNLDIYEFTYDPSEEPPPAKKKRKKPVNKKPAKPKTIVFKNNYDRNVSKALAALKNVVAKKPDVPKVVITPAIENVNAIVAQSKKSVSEQTKEYVQQENTQISTKESANNNPDNTFKPANISNPIEKVIENSVRVEDIAAEFEISVEDYNDINYSPVNSPKHSKSPIVDHQQTLKTSVHNKDPLNLREDLSFFDDNPVASSSMNMSTRHPLASPWRVEFGNLPIKWHVNTYVKPNMTPAVESSFINFEDNNKKHVYTNMIGHDDSAPEVVQNQPNLKQTSIMSFIWEVIQKSAQKKKRRSSVTPTKANLFEDLSKANNVNDKTPKKSEKSVDKNNVSSSPENHGQHKENSNETENKKKKAKIAEKNKDGTFFGFDESEDLENVSPVKVNPKVRALRPRARAVLQEINAMTGPMRALPVAAKSKITASSDAVNKMYGEIKSAADAPVFPEKDSLQKNSEVTTVDEVPCDVDEDEDSQSVHLFEDIELVHHLKPTRKSYGKAKKVTFRQHSTSSETQNLEPEENISSEEDDLADLTFTMPSFQPEKKARKKKTKKQTMSKKEQKALDEWAAGFNSMCEDIDEVPLIVE